MRTSPPSGAPLGALFLLDWRPVFWSTREEYFRRLAIELSTRGITPILVPSELNDPDVLRRFEAAGAIVAPCSYHHGFWNYFHHILGFSRQFTLQFAHVRFFDYFSAVPWLSRLAGIRTIYFTESNGGESKSEGWRRTVVRLRTAVMCRPVTAMVAISEFIRRRLELVGVPPSRITTIYNGVDTSAFRPDAQTRDQLRSQFGCQNTALVLLWVGAFVPIKRPSVAIQVCSELARRGVQVELWIAGDGPLRSELEQSAARENVQAHIRWLGHQRDPHTWMAAADVLLHTTVGEAFGNVLVEAMACGLPVIATHSGAAGEIVQENQSGRLVPPGPQEVPSLADAILDTIQPPERYAAWSENAQRSAALFSTATCVRRTLEFYEARGPQS